VAVESPEQQDGPRRDEGDDDVPEIIEKLREARERHARRAKPIRWLYAAVGLTVLLAGLAMLVLPGPALAVIPIGLFILALEFEWAEEWLERSVKQADKAKRAAAETSRTTRILSAVAITLAVAGVVAWAILGDIPLLPV
jgi:uncharacterized protein (TIGR02611 family)